AALGQFAHRRGDMGQGEPGHEPAKLGRRTREVPALDRVPGRTCHCMAARLPENPMERYLSIVYFLEKDPVQGVVDMVNAKAARSAVGTANKWASDVYRVLKAANVRQM